MKRRVTIMIDDDWNKKIRLMQAKIIQKDNKSISFSFVINLLLKRSLE